LIFHCGEDSKDPRPADHIRGTTAEEQAAFTFQNIQDTLEGLEVRWSTSSDHNTVRDPRDESSYLKARQNISASPAGHDDYGVQLAYQR